MKELALVLGVLVLIGLCVMGPVFTIWSVNTMFHTTYEVTYTTYFSVMWLQIVLFGDRFKTSKK